MAATNKTITMVQAKPSDLDTACAILREASQWLVDRGTPNWRPDEVGPEAMRGAVEAGEFYFAMIDGEPAGTIILQEVDELFWPELTDGRSLFFHKLAVRRKFAKQGVPEAMMQFARDVAKKRGKDFLRLDCQAEHKPLRAYYASHGFTFLDQKKGGWRLVDRFFAKISHD